MKIPDHTKIVAVVILLISVLSLLVYYTYNDAVSLVKKQYNDEQMLVAGQTAVGIEQGVERLIRELELLSRADAIRDMDLKKARNLMEEVFNHVKHLNVNDLALINSKGICKIPLRSSHLEGVDFSYRGYFNEAAALKKNTPVFEFITFLGVDIGQRGVIIGMPVFSRNEQFAGIVLFTLKVSDLIKGFIPAHSADREMWVIDTDGPILYHEEFGPGEDIKEIPRVDITLKAFVDNIKLGKPYQGEYVSPTTLKEVASSSPVRIGDQTWALVIATPERVVSRLLNSFSLKYLFATLVAVATIGGVLLLVYRSNVRLKAEESALRKSEGKYNAILENMSNGVAVYQPAGDGEDFVFVGFNRAAEEIEGIDKESVIGKSVLEVFPGFKDFGLFSVFQQVLATGRPEHPPVAFYEDERISGWRENYVYKLPSGEIVTVYSDETKTKQAEEATKLAYSELDQIFQMAGSGMRVVDKDSNVLRVNQTFVELSGVSKTEAMVKKCYDVFSGAACHTSECHLSRILAGAERTEHEGIKVRADGTEVPCIITAVPFRDPDGKLIGVVEDFKDITERKQAEEALKQAHGELEMRVKERTAELVTTNEQLIREIEVRKEAEERIRDLSRQLLKAQEVERQWLSYELHDNLAQVLAAGKIAIDSLLASEPEALSDTKQKMPDVSGIIQKCIAIVREMAYDLQSDNLNQLGLIQAVRDHCEELAMKSGIEVDFSSAGVEEKMFDVDMKISLYRIIQESLNNVVKHADASRVTVRIMASFPNVIVRIEDDGKGFDVEKRLLDTIREKRMGLRSMEQRASLLEGKLRIESHLMEGTKIIAEVPCSS